MSGKTKTAREVAAFALFDMEENGAWSDGALHRQLDQCRLSPRDESHADHHGAPCPGRPGDAGLLAGTPRWGPSWFLVPCRTSSSATGICAVFRNSGLQNWIRVCVSVYAWQFISWFCSIVFPRMLQSTKPSRSFANMRMSGKRR